jgi:hypothetical protein
MVRVACVQLFHGSRSLCTAVLGSRCYLLMAVCLAGSDFLFVTV